MKTDKIQLYKAADGWRWTYYASNGLKMANGLQGYSRRQDAYRGAVRVTGIDRKNGLDVEVTR